MRRIIIIITVLALGLVSCSPKVTYIFWVSPYGELIPIVIDQSQDTTYIDTTLIR